MGIGKKKENKFGRGFHVPFIEPDYYKKYSYVDVLNEVRKDFENDFYVFKSRAKNIRLTADADLNKLIKDFVHDCPDLFESDNPDARKIVAHFGKLINTLLFAQTPGERKEAKDIIGGILTKPSYVKGSKINIPKLLSLNDMFNYLHKITKYLKQLYIKSIGSELINDRDKQEVAELENIDKRLAEIAQEGKLKLLLKQPTRFTTVLMADFLKLKEKTLEQELKEERKHPLYYTPKKR